MEEKIKCSVCGKEVPTNEVVKDKKGNVICKNCKKKSQKRVLVWCLILLAKAAIAAGIYYYVSTRPIEGNDQSIAIETPTIEIQDVPEFNIAETTPIAPSAIGQTIDNLQSFKELMEQNIAEAKEDNSSNIEIPNVSALFAFNSAKLNFAGQELICEFINAYKQTNQQNHIVINGYACNIGPNYANNYISKERANIVKDFLIANGISEDKVEVNWYGKTMNHSFNYEKISDYRRVIIGIK